MKLYQSEAWLRRKYLTERQSEVDIAKTCNVDVKTIQRYLDKYGIRGKR